MRKLLGEENTRRVKRSLWRAERALGLERGTHLAMGDLDEQIARRLGSTPGFFVEFGAYDGLQYSNTFALAQRGWRGLLIEPSARLAQECCKNRPDSLVVRCALVSGQDGRDDVELHYAGLMSVVASSAGLTTDQQRRVTVGARMQEMKRRIERVPARTLTGVLEDCGVTVIDFMSIDVEGNEAGVLQGLDLTRYTPKVILIETKEPEIVTSLLAPLYRLDGQASSLDYFFKLSPSD